MLDERGLEHALASHPLSPHLALARKMLREALDGSDYLAVMADRDGVLLWADGSNSALAAAEPSGFLPGHLCSESAVGTNAVGTSLEIDHALQVFSGEHFNRHLHPLTSAAAPIRDPETRQTIGVLNFSGPFRTGHPQNLGLVSSVARLVEATLVNEMLHRDDRLRAKFIELLSRAFAGHSALVTSTGRVLAACPKGWLGGRLPLRTDGTPIFPDGVEVEDLGAGALLVKAKGTEMKRRSEKLSIRPLDRGRVQVSTGEWTCDLSRRRSQLLILLALNPQGLTAAEVGELAYSGEVETVTVRSEMARLRRVLGPMVSGNPYRLDAVVDADLPRLRIATLLQPCGSRA